MSVIKSFSVDEGDTFYIDHNSDNFTMIDCCMSDDGDRDAILGELKSRSKNKGIVRFISTHPDDDHIRGLVDLDDELRILNFYCVKNEATKPDKTDDFDRYCELRDHERKAFYLYRGCSRRWMNQAGDGREAAGISILWPITDNADFKAELQKVKDGESPNNISPIVKYSLKDGATVIWMGDLGTKFMDKVKDEISLPEVDVLFAPHHGRSSGKVPQEWLDAMSPKIVIIGEAPSEHLDYYAGYDTITQNSAGDIVLECVEGKIHIYVESDSYSVDFLDDDYKANTCGNYLGTLDLT